MPFVWSTYGAPDAAVSQALAVAASKAQRVSRAGTPKETLARWRCRLAVAIWRRSARMAQPCIRPLADPELYTEHNRGCVAEAHDDAMYGTCHEGCEADQ